MSYTYHLLFKKSLFLKEEGEELFLVNPPLSALRISKPTPGIRQVLDALSGAGGQENALYELMVKEDGPTAGPTFYFYLRKLDEKGFLCRSVINQKGPLATLVPTSQYFRFQEAAIDSATHYILSRFAYCHKEDRDMVLESPLGHGKLILNLPGSLAIIHKLAKPRTMEDLVNHIEGVALEEARAFFNLLLNLKAVCEVREGVTPLEEDDPVLAPWEFHDLLFHARSRRGRHDNPVGGNYRFLGKLDPLPAQKPKTGGEAIPLSRPDLDSLKRNDPPFSVVLEARRSIREYGPMALSAEQLGEFLFRAARVRKFHEAEPQRGSYYQSTNRPYPGGGAVYELELYPLINACDGIESGLYYYDPFEHELWLISKPNKETERLIDDAYTASALEHELGVLMVITARFQRVNWKYASIAYSLILKDVGVLLQNMYLVATAMGLAPCALGAGDSDLFARAAGIDYLTESSVGEFILGRLA